MKFCFKKNLVLIIYTIRLNCLVLSSGENRESEAIVQTQLTRPEHEPVNRQKSNFVLDSNLLENLEGVTFLWIKKKRFDLDSSESLLDESRNETTVGVRKKRNVNTAYYYQTQPDEMPWKYADSVYDEPPEHKQKVVKAGIALLAAVIGKFILKLVKLFVFALSASPLLLVPGLLYTSLLAGIFLGRIFQARNGAGATPGSAAGTTTTTTVAPGTGMGMADLWTGPNLSGAGAAIGAPIGTCVDFPPVFDKMLQSLDTKNSCVIICDTAGCVGTCIRFMNAGIVNDLGSFNNMASSIMFC